MRKCPRNSSHVQIRIGDSRPHKNKHFLIDIEARRYYHPVGFLRLWDEKCQGLECPLVGRTTEEKLMMSRLLSFARHFLHLSKMVSAWHLSLTYIPYYCHALWYAYLAARGEVMIPQNFIHSIMPESLINRVSRINQLTLQNYSHDLYKARAKRSKKYFYLYQNLLGATMYLKVWRC